MEDQLVDKAESVETGEEPAHVTRADRREMQTARILEAAKKCFVRSGFQGASMHEICTEAGMSPGALYRYFPSKEAIIEAIAEADRRTDAQIMSQMLDNPDVVDGFVSAAIAHIRHTHESGNAALFSEIRAESVRNEALRKSCDCSMDQVREAFRDYLKAAIDRNEIRPAVDLDTLMSVMMAIGEGLVLNDLPGRGISYENIDTMIRAAVTANLRPTRGGQQDSDK